MSQMNSNDGRESFNSYGIGLYIVPRNLPKTIRETVLILASFCCISLVFIIWLRSNSKPSSIAHITRWRFGGSSSTWSSMVEKMGCHSCTIVESGHQKEQFLFKWTGEVTANNLDVPLCHIEASVCFEETSAVKQIHFLLLASSKVSPVQYCHSPFQWHRFKQVWINLIGWITCNCLWVHRASQHSDNDKMSWKVPSCFFQNVTDIASVTCRFYCWHIKFYILVYLTLWRLW